MAISRCLYGSIGVAAIGGFACFVQASALTPLNTIDAQDDVSVSESFAIAPEERSLNFHTAGIRKALAGDYVNAITDYDQALALSPQNPEIYYNRAVAHYSVGNNKLALQDFDRALQLQPTMAEAYANRSTLRLELGNVEGAITDGQKAAALFEQQGEPDLAIEMRDWVKQHRAIANF